MSENKEGTNTYLTRRDFLKVIFPLTAATFLELKRAENRVISAVIPTISPTESPTSTPEARVQNLPPTPETTEEPLPVTEQKEIVLSSKSISLNDRHPKWSVNEIVRKNILLCLAYMSGRVDDASDIDWATVESPFQYEFTLQPGEVFAFHDQVLPQYAPATVTTRSNFSFEQGYLWDGKYYGGGICDLASFMCWAAKTAGLDQTYVPTRHTKPIPDIPDEYTVAIFYGWERETHNLYIPNSMDKSVKFIFTYREDTLTVKVIREEKI